MAEGTTQTNAWELYRNCLLAECLLEALEELNGAGKIPEELAVKIFSEFDKSMMEAFHERVQAKANLKGSIEVYRYHDNVWQFYLKDVTFKLNPTGSSSMSQIQAIPASKCKVVCLDSKLIGEQE